MEDRPRRNLEKILAYVAIGATLALQLYAVEQMFSTESYLRNWDGEFYTLKGHYWATHLLPLGRVSGWFPLWLGGFDYYVMYPPLTAFIAGLASLLISPVLVTRLYSVALWLFMVLASYQFLRRIGLNRMVAAAGASLTAAVNVGLSVGFKAIFLVGFLPQALGFSLSVLTLGRLYSLLQRDRFDAPASVRSGAFLGLLVAAHHFSALWFMLASVICLVTQAARAIAWREKVKNMALMYAVGGALSAFWWFPLLLNRSLMVNVAPIFPAITAELSLEHVHFYLSPLLPTMGAVGAIYLFGAGRHRLAWMLVLTLAYSILQTFGYVPFPIEIVNKLQSRRFHGYIDWMIVVLLTFCFQALHRFYSRFVEQRWMPTVFTFVLLVFVQFQIRSVTFNHHRKYDLFVTPAARSQMDELARHLKGKFQTGEFHFSEARGDTRRTGGWHFLHVNLVRLVPGLWDLTGGYPEAIRGAEKPFFLSRAMPTIYQHEEYLRKRGVKYVSTLQPATARAIEKTAPFLKKVWEPADPKARDVALFEVTEFNSRFGLEPSAASKLETLEYSAPGKFELSFSTPISLPAGATFAMNYHPWLRVTADGRPLSTTPDEDWTLAITEPVDRATKIKIRYSSPFVVTLVRFLSLAAWIATFLFLFRNRRIRARNAT